MRIIIAPVQCSVCGQSISADDYYCARCGNSTLERPWWPYALGVLAVLAMILWQAAPPPLRRALAEFRDALGL